MCLCHLTSPHLLTALVVLSQFTEVSRRRRVRKASRLIRERDRKREREYLRLFESYLGTTKLASNAVRSNSAFGSTET